MFATVCFYLLGGWVNEKWDRDNFQSKEYYQFVDLYMNLDLEIPIEEVVKTLGEPATEISEASGVLVRTNYFISGEDALKHGTPEPHQLYKWEREACSFIVVVDKDGIAKGKWLNGVGHFKKYANQKRHESQ